MNDIDEGKLDLIYNFTSILLGSLTIIPIILALLSFVLYKKMNSKEDFMHLQKLITKLVLYFFFFTIFLSVCIFKEEINVALKEIHALIFAICLLNLGFIDLKINYEKYMKFYDPTFVINGFISKSSKSYIYEGFYFSFSIIFAFLYYKYINFERFLELNDNIIPTIFYPDNYNINNIHEGVRPKHSIVKNYFSNEDIALTTSNQKNIKLDKLFYMNNFNISLENDKKIILDFGNNTNINSNNTKQNIKKLIFKNNDVMITERYVISSLVFIYPILLILTIISIFYKIKKLKIMSSIENDYKYCVLIEKEIKAKKKVEFLETFFIIFNLLFFLSSSVLIFFIYRSKIYNPEVEINSEYGFYLNIISLYYFLINFFEAIFFMFYISRTDFYKYTLGNTSFAKIYRIFNPEIVEKPAISIDSSFNNSTNNNFYKERSKELNSTCIYFHNNLLFSIDEIFVNMFDNIINIVLATVTKITQEKLKNQIIEINKYCNNYNSKFENEENRNFNHDQNKNIIIIDEKENIKAEKDLNNSNDSVKNLNGEFNNNKYFVKNENEESFDFQFNGNDEIERKNVNNQSFGEKVKNETYTNGNLVLKETDYKTSLINETYHINKSCKFRAKENKKRKIIKNDSKKDNENSQARLFKFHEFKISKSENDFKDEKLLRLININAANFQDQENLYTNDPTYQRIQEENQHENLILSQAKRNLVSSNLLSGMDLKIQVKEYYEKEFEEILDLKKIDLNLLEKSFMSHFNQKQNNFTSLFSHNAKEELFKKQENLVIRTSDKMYNFEFLTNCNDNLNEDDSKNGNLFHYTNYLKENESTFLPLVIGVFKIKINNLKELKVVVSKNNLIEDIPKETFNYWQLIRIKEKNSFEMITSSKDRQSLLVSDELLIKNDTKFNLFNFNDFAKILFSDLNFLGGIGSSSHSLLIMYYEMGKSASRNTNNSLSEDEAKFMERNGKTSSKSIFGMNNNFNNVSAIRPFGEPSILDFSLKVDLNLLHVVNGFQSNVNDYRCILFFMFDNIFRKKTFLCFENLCINKHKNFLKMISSKFQEIKDL